MQHLIRSQSHPSEGHLVGGGARGGGALHGSVGAQAGTACVLSSSCTCAGGLHSVLRCMCWNAIWNTLPTCQCSLP